jgi:ABC-type dipeptide/oligopeptide/nickel transport system permease subunit
LLLPLGALALSAWGGSSAATALVLARTIGATFAALAGAAVVGLTLGLFAGGLSRTADLVLARGLELASALPQPFLAAACFLLGGVPGALALGCLRGFEIAQVLRDRIHELRASDSNEPRSFGRAPLAPYVRHILPAALAPFTTMFMLSIPWLFTLEAASARLGGMTARTLGSLASTTTPTLLGLTLFTLALFLLARELTPHEYVGESPAAPVALALNRRIGASSYPPPPPRDDSEP